MWRSDPRIGFTGFLAVSCSSTIRVAKRERGNRRCSGPGYEAIRAKRFGIASTRTSSATCHFHRGNVSAHYSATEDYRSSRAPAPSLTQTDPTCCFHDPSKSKPRVPFPAFPPDRPIQQGFNNVLLLHQLQSPKLPSVNVFLVTATQQVRYCVVPAPSLGTAVYYILCFCPQYCGASDEICRQSDVYTQY